MFGSKAEILRRFLIHCPGHVNFYARQLVSFHPLIESRHALRGFVVDRLDGTPLYRTIVEPDTCTITFVHKAKCSFYLEFCSISTLLYIYLVVRGNNSTMTKRGSIENPATRQLNVKHTHTCWLNIDIICR